MTTLNSLKWFLVFLGMIFCYKFIRLERTVSTLETKIKKYKTVHKINTALARASQNCYTLPEALQSIPLANADLLLDVKKIPIRDVYAPYNASIIERENDGYYLFFRYDLITNMHSNHFFSKIGMVELDKNLSQTEKKFVEIDTKSNYSEDPRAFKIKGTYYLSYNDHLPNGGKRRGIFLGELNQEKNAVIHQQPLELFMNQFEKNWVPFIKISENELPKIYFEYQLASPRKILEKTINSIKHVPQSNLQKPNELEWTKKWGLLRGGTPAQLVDGEYLAFFHSSFKDKTGCFWYVLGAYTFESDPPFKMTKISPYPILFRGIYETQSHNSAETGKRVIFPSGFVQTKQGEILLSCGENDCAVKILTFNKKALLDSLQKIQ